MSTISDIAITILGITVALALIGWIGALFAIDPNLPNEISFSIDYIFSFLKSFDWFIPLETLIQCLFLVLTIRIGLFSIDGGILIWKFIKRWHT